MQQLLAAGSFTSEMRVAAQRVCLDYLSWVIRYYIVDHRVLPRDLFEFFDLRTLLFRFGMFGRGRAPFEIPDRGLTEFLGLSWADPLHRTFMEEYMEMRDPSVDPPEPHCFTEAELDACEQGICCQCGLCCIVTLISSAPMTRGNPDPASCNMKQPFEPCPQLVDRGGCLQCYFHGASHKPDVCGAWKGSDPQGKTGVSKYYALCNATASGLIAPPRPQDVGTFQKLLARGILSERIRNLAQEKCKFNLKILVRYYIVNFEVIPQDIFDFLDLRTILQAAAAAERQEITALLNWDNSIHRTFMEEYMGLEAPRFSR
ncbi:MAG: hypothetical protein V1926_01045 [Candidatus Peregrinibacteria bacterium]